MRERTEKGETSVEVVYGITSLGRDRADAARLLGLTRAPGDRERSHCRRDVTLGEDQGRIRTGAAPQVMAALRGAVIHPAAQVGPTIADAVRTLNNCLSKALGLLGIPQLE